MMLDLTKVKFGMIRGHVDPRFGNSEHRSFSFDRCVIPFVLFIITRVSPSPLSSYKCKKNLYLHVSKADYGDRGTYSSMFQSLTGGLQTRYSGSRVHASVGAGYW